MWDFTSIKGTWISKSTLSYNSWTSLIESKERSASNECERENALNHVSRIIRRRFIFLLAISREAGVWGWQDWTRKGTNKEISNSFTFHLCVVVDEGAAQRNLFFSTFTFFLSLRFHLVFTQRLFFMIHEPTSQKSNRDVENGSFWKLRMNSETAANVTG